MLSRLMEKYNKDVLPLRTGMTVFVEIHIQDIPSISELRSDFELDILFSSQWDDPGLNYLSQHSCLTNVTLNLSYLKK